MQERGGILGAVGHLEVRDQYGVQPRDVTTAASLEPPQHALNLIFAGTMAQQQLADCFEGSPAMHFRQQVHQEARLRAVGRAVLVDVEEAQQRVNEVVERRGEVGRGGALLAPALDAEAIALVFLQRRGAEDAEHGRGHPHGFHAVATLPGRVPVERVYVLQHGNDALTREPCGNFMRQMRGCEVRFAEQGDDACLGIPLPDLGEFGGGVAIARTDAAHVVAWHAIEAVDAGSVTPRRLQQLAPRRPIVAPIEIEADALAQLALINLAAHPRVQNALVAGENHLHREQHRTIAGARELLQQLGSVAL